MRTLAELEAEGLHGKALAEAAYEDMFGSPSPVEPLNDEQRALAWRRFLALRETMTPEELNDGFMDHRKRMTETYRGEKRS